MTIFEDLMTAPGSHKRECAQLNRCVCGQEQCQIEQFEAQLKRAMGMHPDWAEAHPDREPKTVFNADAHRQFMRNL